MNQRSKTLGFLVFVMIFTAGCGAAAAPLEEKDETQADSYKDLLGRPVTDQVVADFIVNNHCYDIGGMQFCEDRGMALGINADQVVDAVYLCAYNESLVVLMNAPSRILPVNNTFPVDVQALKEVCKSHGPSIRTRSFPN